MIFPLWLFALVWLAAWATCWLLGPTLLRRRIPSDRDVPAIPRGWIYDRLVIETTTAATPQPSPNHFGGRTFRYGPSFLVPRFLCRLASPLFATAVAFAADLVATVLL